MTDAKDWLRPVLAAGVLGGCTAVVLRRMEQEYTAADTLSRRTVTAMYGVYAAHGAVLSWASIRRIWPLPLPARSAAFVGKATALSGAGIALAGAGPFGPSWQLSGVEPGQLHDRGIYRYSRNPQYLGLILAAAGLAADRRSAFAGLSAAGLWFTYRRWIPSEERHLTRVFGSQYTQYRARVPRWLAIPAPRRGRV